MGSIRPRDGTTRRDFVDPPGAGAFSDAPDDRPTGPDASRLEQLPTGTPLPRAAGAALLLTMAATPFLKGILAGFALAGAAAAVRGMLGA